jgi:hypothetical protein
MADLYGWLNLKGEFEQCQRWGHAEAPSIQQIWEDEGWDKEARQIEAGCEALIAEDEHPEWPHYEMFVDDCRDSAVEIAYKKVLMRVGTKGMEMYFEYGSGAMVDGKLKKCRHQAAVAFAKSKGCTPVFEHVHWA